MIESVLKVLRLFTPVCALLVLSPLSLATPPLAAPGELQEAWSVAAPGPAPWRLHPLTSALLIEDSAGGVTAVDLDEGQPLWSQQMGAPLSVSPREHAGTTVLTAGLKSVALGVVSGNVLDRRQLPAPAAAPAVLLGDNLHVLTLAGSLHTFARGGSQRWAYRGTRGLGENLVLMPNGDRPLLVLTNGAGRLLALPAQSALPTRSAWEVELGSEPVGALQLDAQGTLHVALRNGQLLALAANSGRIQWRHALPGAPGAPALRSGDVVLVGGGWGLQACRADTGKLLWERSGAALPRAANSTSVLLRSGGERSAWARALDGKQLELPASSTQQMIGELLIAWDGTRVRAFSAAHAGATRAANAAGALN